MRRATLAAFVVVALIVVGSTLAGSHLHKEFLLQRAYESLGRFAWMRSTRAAGGIQSMHGIQGNLGPLMWCSKQPVRAIRILQTPVGVSALPSTHALSKTPLGLPAQPIHLVAAPPRRAPAATSQLTAAHTASTPGHARAD